MMKRWIPFFSLSFLVSCGTGGDGSEGEKNTESSGGTAGDGDMIVPAPVPQGPGLDGTVTDSCEVFTCDGSRFGSWTLQSRCDQSGTFADPMCPTGSFAWTLDSASGSLEFDEELGTWDVTTQHSWQISIPADCGACDYQSAWTGTLSNVSCAEDGSGGCACTATSTWVQSFHGYVYALAGDGHFKLVEQKTAEDVQNGTFPPEHEFWTCSGEDDLIIYDEIGARLSFSRVPL